VGPNGSAGALIDPDTPAGPARLKGSNMHDVRKPSAPARTLVLRELGRIVTQANRVADRLAPADKSDEGELRQRIGLESEAGRILMLAADGGLIEELLERGRPGGLGDMVEKARRGEHPIPTALAGHLPPEHDVWNLFTGWLLPDYCPELFAKPTNTAKLLPKADWKSDLIQACNMLAAIVETPAAVTTNTTNGNQPGEEWVTAANAAKAANNSEATIRRWARDKHIVSKPRPGKSHTQQRLYLLSSVRKMGTASPK
jgi:hypothetical protein